MSAATKEAFKYVLIKHVLCAIIIMQGGKQNANETKGDGKTNSCRRMDIQKPRRFSQKLHTSD